MSTPPAKPPEILDKIVDVVVAHRPKSKASNKRGNAAQSSQKKPKKNKNRAQ